MSTIYPIGLKIDSKENSQTQISVLKKSNDRKTYILIGIIVAIALITTIILLAVLLPKKRNKTSRTNIIDTSKKSDEFNQGIELLIDGKDIKKIRCLQEEEKVQILGTNFDELNSINSIIFLDDKKIVFDKYLSINSTSLVNVTIKFNEELSTFKEMFSGCNKIKEISLINVETDLISETTSMFENCYNLNGIRFINTSIYNITNSNNMFQNCKNLNIIDLEVFSTNKVKDMSKMFKGCSSLKDTLFIESLSTNNAIFLNEMFSGCSSIKSLNLSNYDTSNAKNMSGLCKGMSNLEELEISSFDTSKVENMNEMFESCSILSSLNLSNFNTEKVTTMDNMFSNCLNLTKLDVTSFHLTSCNSTKNMFTNTTRELMLFIEKNEELMKLAGISWSEREDKDSNITKTPLDLLFLVDATGSMSSVIKKVKDDIIYIAVNLLKKKGMEIFDLSLGVLFYRDPIVSLFENHQKFDFDKNALNFKNFVDNITAYGGGDLPEDWAGAFNLAKTLSWRKIYNKVIIHIADAPGHGLEWAGYNNFNEEGKKTDDIIGEFANETFNIAGFKIGSSASKSFSRAQDIFKKNKNQNYFITEFSVYNQSKDYFLDLVYPFLNKFKDFVEIIKNKAFEWREANVGAHYYAFSPYLMGYSKIKSYIKLPNELETKNLRNAYISFGVAGDGYAIDIGIKNNGTGWHPYYYDKKGDGFIDLDDYLAPLDTSIIGIELDINSDRIVNFSLTYIDSNSKQLKTFQKDINASHILASETIKPILRFYRFASLVNIGEDYQNDNTYMYGGKFTDLTIVKDNVDYPWGIGSDDIEAAWKVSYQRINFSYTDNSDTFDIHHKPI